MGKASRRKRERRRAAIASGPVITGEERVVLKALIDVFVEQHGRKPVPGDIICVDDDGSFLTLNINLPADI